ncbi:hypothetical protein SUGI_0866360 [Cryptomeria japonica]|uniref:uncharacterized protein LOC131029010 n=1 Tax=Cryptomeria japonica TaxID=3369 RepID=UPI00241491D5|nr:uncharacterized protein LOC131029010 [Cryptomeria japonica]GLJ41847.1 hypothetical protein SUGI_0866360 [Cryptomeria japonica]
MNRNPVMDDLAEFWKAGEPSPLGQVGLGLREAIETKKRSPSQTIEFPDVYDWICHLDQSTSQNYKYLPLNVHPGKAGSLFLGSRFTASNKVSLFLSSGIDKLFDLGMCSTGIVGEESRQRNKFRVFSNMYTRVYFKVFDPDLAKLEQMDIQLGTIESTKFKQAFNSLFSVTCYHFLVQSRFEICESEMQKLPYHRTEEVLSIIGPGFPDVYDWLCHLDPSTSQKYKYLALNLHCGKAGLFLLVSRFIGSNKVCLFLSAGADKRLRLGMCDTGMAGEESRQKNTSRLFWNLCARVYFNAFDPDLVKLRQLDIELGTIECAKYKQAFNSLLSVACYSFLVHSGLEISESGLQKLPCHRAEDILPIIGSGATDRLLRCLSTEITYKCVHGKNDNKGGNELRISYCSSSLPGYWIINSYCPMLSMSRTSKGQFADRITSDKRLYHALNYQQLQCILQFRHAVNVYRDFIEVKLEIDSVGCDVIRLHPPHEPISTSLEGESHFPARICITIGPQVESHVHSVSLTKSSQNPVTNIARGKAVEATFEPPDYVPGLKISNGMASQISIKSWVFEQSSVNRPHVNLEWTLYDSTTGKAVSNYKPQRFSVFNSKTWSGDRYSKDSRAFTAQGGVVFAGDEYGQPTTWRLNRDLQGQTVNWVVKGDICLAYFPNTYRSSHFDIANHQFCQLVQFPLVQSTPN